MGSELSIDHNRRRRADSLRGRRPSLELVTTGRGSDEARGLADGRCEIALADAWGLPFVTLGSRMSFKDRTAFVGRAAELALLDRLLVDDPPASVLLVHGPAGIGKSALLREAGRRGRAAGRSVVTVEGRELPPLPASGRAWACGSGPGPTPTLTARNYSLTYNGDGARYQVYASVG